MLQQSISQPLKRDNAMIEHTVTKIDGSVRAIELSRRCYTLTSAQKCAYDDYGAENEILEDDDCDVEPSFLI